MEHSYRTLKTHGAEILYKDRKSKFFGQAFRLQREEEVQPLLDELRQRHKGVGHVCYAWRLGKDGEHWRANDDGEPANSAGMPIYGQLQAFDITYTLVAVARVYGGTKLGVGGLIQAYRTAAQQALENSEIIVQQILSEWSLDFDYPDLDKVMRAISQLEAQILEQTMELDCHLKIALPECDENKLQEIVKGYHKVTLKKLV